MTRLWIAAILFLGASTMAQADDWQPIETAPKDGHQIWAWAEGKCGAVEKKFDCQWQGVIYWQKMLLVDQESFWAGLPSGMAPTHWRELPAPPSR